MVRIGIEKLRDSIRGKRIGLLMNNTALDDDGQYLIETICLDWKADVKRLFAMEHGVWGELQPGIVVENQNDPITGLPISTLYGESGNRPNPSQIEDLDAIVFCAQDVGIRHWTYTMHMGYCMEAMAAAGKEMIVIDLPNPIGGDIVEGAPLEMSYTSLIGAYPIPLRHGMTAGEIALYINDACGIHCALTVIEMEGWNRGMWGDETGRFWVAPAPNVPTVDSLIGFAAIGLLQSTNVSVGRGTTNAFSLFGAPWMDGRMLTERINAMKMPGLHCLHKRYLPMFSQYAGEVCSGVLVLCDDRKAFRAVSADLRILHTLQQAYGDQFVQYNGKEGAFDRRAGTAKLHETLASGASIEPLVAEWEEQARLFAERRKPYLLYK